MNHLVNLYTFLSYLLYHPLFQDFLSVWGFVQGMIFALFFYGKVVWDITKFYF